MERTALPLAIALILLVLLDQGVKLVIARGHMGVNRAIWGRRLRLRPVQNKKQTWLGARGVPLFGNRAFAIGVKLLVLWFGLHGCRYLLAGLQLGGAYLTAAASLFLAGAACSLIDSVFWGGSIDYLCIRGRVIVDLKDIYLGVFGLLVLLSLFLFPDFPEGGSLRELGRYCLLLR